MKQRIQQYRPLLRTLALFRSTSWTNIIEWLNCAKMNGGRGGSCSCYGTISRVADGVQSVKRETSNGTLSTFSMCGRISFTPRGSLARLVKSNVTGALCSVLSVTWLCERDRLTSQQLLPPPSTVQYIFLIDWFFKLDIIFDCNLLWW